MKRLKGFCPLKNSSEVCTETNIFSQSLSNRILLAYPIHNIRELKINHKIYDSINKTPFSLLGCEKQSLQGSVIHAVAQTCLALLISFKDY